MHQIWLVLWGRNFLLRWGPWGPCADNTSQKMRLRWDLEAIPKAIIGKMITFSLLLFLHYMLIVNLFHVHCVSLKQKPFHPVITGVEKPVGCSWRENPSWTAAHRSYLQRWLLAEWKCRNRAAKLIFLGTEAVSTGPVSCWGICRGKCTQGSLAEIVWQCTPLCLGASQDRGGGVQGLCTANKILLRPPLERLWAWRYL